MGVRRERERAEFVRLLGTLSAAVGLTTLLIIASRMANQHPLFSPPGAPAQPPSFGAAAAAAAVAAADHIEPIDVSAERLQAEFATQSAAAAASLRAAEGARQQQVDLRRRAGKPRAKLVGRASWVTQAGDRDGPGGAAAYNHMAMLERLRDGRLLHAWQASNEGEGKPDQHIRLATSEDGGRSWSRPVTPGWGQPVSGAAVWAPVLHRAEDDSIWAFFARSTAECRAPGGDLLVTRLPPGAPVEGGWEEPRRLLSFAEERINKVIANKPIVLRSGDWVLPFWRERGRSCKSVTTEMSSGVLVSSDAGQTWEARGHIRHPKTWLIEQTVAELASGEIVMLCRTATGSIYSTRSDDKGRSWSSAEPMQGLPNPNAKIAMLSLSSSHHECPGCLVLAFNDHREYAQPYRRTRSALRVAVSYDGGVRWPRVLTLEDNKVPGLRHHYPTLCELPAQDQGGARNTRLAITYSTFFMKGFKKVGSREGIRFATFELSFAGPKIDDGTVGGGQGAEGEQEDIS